MNATRLGHQGHSNWYLRLSIEVDIDATRVTRSSLCFVYCKHGPCSIHAASDQKLEGGKKSLETQKLIPSLVAGSACSVSDNIDFCHILSHGCDGLHNTMGTIQ